MMLRTEADVVEALAGSAFTIDELYAACQDAGVTSRDNGHDSIEGHGSDQVWRRRARSALQSLRRADRAERVSRGTWIIDGAREAPRRMLLVICPSDPGQLELVLADAERFLRESDQPYDLVLADPPWGLYRDEQYGAEFDPHDRGGRLYGRNRELVVPGYAEATGDYGEFTHRWIEAAAGVLAPDAYLAVITGTSVAWRIGHAAHDVGLNEVCQIAAQRRFALRTTRRPSHAHWVISVYSSAQRDSKTRFFNCIPELPKSRSGGDYPLDIWAGDDAPPKVERRGALRYRNALPVELVDRLVRMFTAGPDSGVLPWTSLVADPFLGSGTTAVACLRSERRFRGADVNPNALRFTAARLTVEEFAA